jgi:hypothetical protein
MIACMVSAMRLMPVWPRFASCVVAAATWLTSTIVWSKALEVAEISCEVTAISAWWRRSGWR